MAKSYEATSVFTPSMPAVLTFVERDETNDALVDAIQTPGLQIFLSGSYGSGKSTLMLNKLRQLYDYHIATVCIDELTVESIFTSAFDQLDSFYVSEKSSKRGSKFFAKAGSDRLVKLTLGLEKGTEESAKLRRSAPQLLSPENMTRLLDTLGACWLLEDVDRLAPEVLDRIATYLKIFTMTAVDHRRVKILMTSNKDHLDRFWDDYPALRHRVGAFNLGRMTDDQLAGIIEKGCSLLNVEISDSERARIVEGAQGSPRDVHAGCLRLCQEEGIHRTCETRVFLV
ncbi:P-loop NTPase fold protein [Candidatus Bipolaricaulota bacterium]